MCLLAVVLLTGCWNANNKIYEEQENEVQDILKARDSINRELSRHKQDSLNLWWLWETTRPKGEDNE